jgi:two-component system sensor histidine kinase CpxA
MRSLFFKIFIIFWIAQSLIFVLSTALIIRHRVPHPEFVLNALFNEVQAESLSATEAFESGGCTALNAMAQKNEGVFVLQDANGAAVCPTSHPFALPDELRNATQTIGKRVGDQYLWRVPATSASGKKYFFLLTVQRIEKQPSLYQDVFHFTFPQLPVAIAVSGVTTFALVLLFTRPVIRLRKAARALAQGNLSARVQQPPQFRTFSGDEFHALAHDFNHMAERLQSLVDAQTLLLRDVSHELRSPLARLSVALELSREDADPAMATHLDRIQREAERLNHLIGQLLTLSSMEAVENIQTFEPVQLKSLLEEMLPDAEFEAKMRAASVELDASCDCVVEGRRELIYSAIENIVRNAIRYTAQGSKVEIRLRRAAEPSAPVAIIEISDRGPGIPAGELESIFRPFYRVDQARSTDTGGVGVGLAIADRAVKLHGGQIWAINRQGGGTTVQIRLRIADTKHPQQANSPTITSAF